MNNARWQPGVILASGKASRPCERYVEDNARTAMCNPCALEK